ncbi:glycosyltransferase family 4 protein [Microbacterium binotii]
MSAVGARGSDPALRIAVLNPWGRTGSYGGPVVLSRVLFPVVRREPGVLIDLFTWAGSSNGEPEWADRHVLVPRLLGRLPGDLGGLLWGVWAGLAVRVRRRTFDVVYLHGAYLPNLVAARLSGMPEGTLAVLPVLEGGDLAPTRRAKSRLLRWVVARLRVGFALSAGIERELLSLGLPPERVVRIGNPVSTDAFSGTSHRPSHDSTTLRIGFVGKVGPVKRPDLVVRAVGALVRSGVEATVTFAGPFSDRIYERRFSRIIEEEGLGDRVTMTGFVSDVASVLAQTDVLALPSSAEGMPGALAEAMVAGVPAIVTDVGAMGEHVTAADAGFVVEPTVAALTSALGTLARDHVLRASLAANARAYGLATFADRAVAERFVDALQAHPVLCHTEASGPERNQDEPRV